MQVYNNTIRPNSIQQHAQADVKQTATQPNFQTVLNDKIASTTSQDILFSKHANMRLGARDINLSTEQLRRLEHGISKAKEKGISDSLVLVDNIALVVNVKNKTVVTAMNRENENIFTNIDGAVIV